MSRFRLRVGWLARPVGGLVLILVALVVAWLTIGGLVGDRAVRGELRAWADAGQSMQDLRTRYPTVPNSPEAVELARLAEDAGIHLLATGTEVKVTDDKCPRASRHRAQL